MYTGSIVAMVTPFKAGQIDPIRTEELIEWHLAEGTKAIVVLGCTGEAFTISAEERATYVTHVIRTIKKRCPVIVGTGAPGLREALEQTQSAKELGATAALVITPYGNKPNQDGLYEYYSELSQRSKLPIILYNVPSRTGCCLHPETVARLSERRSIVAIKEASGDLGQIVKIRSLCALPILSGDDALTLPIMAIGGVGVISTVANLVPKDMQRLIDLFNEGKLKEAADLNLKLSLLISTLFQEGNPAPLKMAMKLVGKLNGELRAPLHPVGQNTLNVLRRALKEYGLL